MTEERLVNELARAARRLTFYTRLLAKSVFGIDLGLGGVESPIR